MNKDLAGYIRAGLRTPGVTPDAFTCGVNRFGNNIIANTLGLALIGKFGLDQALRICEEAYGDDPVKSLAIRNQMYSALGISEREADDIAAANFSTPADQIAVTIESQEFDSCES